MTVFRLWWVLEWLVGQRWQQRQLLVVSGEQFEQRVRLELQCQWQFEPPEQRQSQQRQLDALCSALGALRGRLAFRFPVLCASRTSLSDRRCREKRVTAFLVFALALALASAFALVFASMAISDKDSPNQHCRKDV